MAKKKPNTHLPSELDGKVERNLHATLVTLLVGLTLVADDTAEGLDIVLRDGDGLAFKLVRNLEGRHTLGRRRVERPEVPVVLRKTRFSSLNSEMGGQRQDSPA